MSHKKHVPVPKDTRAFFCANCGAVALDAANVCKVWARVRRLIGVELRG